MNNDKKMYRGYELLFYNSNYQTMNMVELCLFLSMKNLQWRVY